MIPIGTRTKYLRNMAIVSISLSGFFMVVFGIILGILATRVPDMETFMGVVVLLIFVLVLFGGILAWQIVMLVLIMRCPEDLISQEGNSFRMYVKGRGYMNLPCAAVVAVKPVNAMLMSGWIAVASGRFDATLEITATDGANYRVPFVRLAQQTADTMLRIAYEVRMRNMTPPAPQPAATVEAPQTEPQTQPTDDTNS